MSTLCILDIILEKLDPSKIELDSILLSLPYVDGLLYVQMASADEVVKTMIDHMTDPSSQSHLPLKSGRL